MKYDTMTKFLLTAFLFSLALLLFRSDPHAPVALAQGKPVYKVMQLYGPEAAVIEKLLNDQASEGWILDAFSARDDQTLADPFVLVFRKD